MNDSRENRVIWQLNNALGLIPILDKALRDEQNQNKLNCMQGESCKF
jgi:hypothetical protein